MPLFWLSFSDYARPAVDIARRLGAIGDVSIADLDDCSVLPSAAYQGRMLTNSDIDEMEATVGAERSKAAATAAIQHAILLPRDDSAV